MKVPYTKMHGTGNVILVVDQRTTGIQPPGDERIVQLGEDTTGPGFDQMMWLGPAADPDCVASYRVFNADGSEVEQCGNGVRCVARYLAQDDKRQRHFWLQSPAGPVEARIHNDGQVAVSMGRPVFAPSEIPFDADDQASQYTLLVGDRSIDVSVLSMGNPHCILTVESVDTAAVNDLGPRIEHHARFPERTNVGFMQLRDRQNIALRVHERGVGETQACGTGSCAAVVAGIKLGVLDNDVRVQLPGGEVMVSWRGARDPVWLRGNAEVINDGTMNL